MINAKLGLAFIREKYNFQKIEQILGNFEIVFTENYYSNDWSINLIDLRKEVSEICWHTPENVVNTNCFSLDDFYFATI